MSWRELVCERSTETSACIHLRGSQGSGGNDEVTWAYRGILGCGWVVCREGRKERPASRRSLLRLYSFRSNRAVDADGEDKLVEELVGRG